MFTRLFVLFLLVVATVSVSTPVHAATDPGITASCYGVSCNGLHPYTTTCINDAVAVAYAEGYALRVWRIYSPSCNAYYVEAWGSHPYYEVTAYMRDNWQATVVYQGGGAASKMWASGLGCAFNAQFGSGACA